MKKQSKIIGIFMAAIMLLGIFANNIEAYAASTYESIFQKDGIIDVKIELSEADWQSMLSNPTAEEYKSATVTVNGTKVTNVGFRTKGNSSLQSVDKSDSDRYSFRVKFDKYVKGQTLLGLDELVLNNMYSDPSYLREYLSYEAMKSAGLATPKTVFANIYINGKLSGFYLCIEAIDDTFVESNFGSSKGNLYKAEQGSDLIYKDGSNYDSLELKIGSDESKMGLKNLIKVLNDMSTNGYKTTEIEKILNIDSVLSYIAANTVLANYDSYAGNLTQNYYLYELNGKFTLIPWDYNMSFGGFSGMGGGAAGDVTTIPIDEPVMGVNISNLPLIKNLLSVSSYKQTYYQYINKYVSYLDTLENRVTQLAAIVRPYVKADPTKFYSLEDFESAVSKTAATAVSSTATVSQQQGNVSSNMQPPQGFDPSNMQPPQGFENNRGGFQGGGMGGGNMKATINLISYAKSRSENIKKQLSGELPKTGNTTMNNTGMGRPGGNFQGGNFPGGMGGNPR